MSKKKSKNQKIKMIFFKKNPQKSLKALLQNLPIQSPK